MIERQLTSFDIYTIVSELNEIKDSFIDKTYQISKDELIIRINNINRNKKEFIYIKNGNLLCLTDKKIETPQKPSTFAMALRKYLQNGRIIEIEQHEFDRIIKIKIGKKEGIFSLIIELFSNGNIILVNPDNKIIIPFVRQNWAFRKIKGKEEYSPPPSQINPFILDYKQFKSILLKSTSDIVRTLAVNLNLSGIIAEEICNLAEIKKNVKMNEIEEKTIEKIYETLKEFLNLFKDKKFNPVVVIKGGEIKDILPFKFESYENATFKKIDQYVRGLELFIDKRKQIKKIDDKTVEKTGKLNRQLNQQKEAVFKLNRQIADKKIEGELIYLHFQEIKKLLIEIQQILVLKKKESKIEHINKKDLVEKFEPQNNLLILNLEDLKNKNHQVRIDFRKTVFENAEKKFDENKKLKRKLSGAEKSLKKTKGQIKKLEKDQKVLEKDDEKKPIVREKKFWFERFRWFISSQGNIIVGGKDAKSNDIVVKKYLDKGDRFAHADIQGAPSIVIKSKGIDNVKLEITEQTLDEACIFAASYSKAWKQFAEAQSYWVNPEQVSKTPESGEYIPRGAFIIRGKRNYRRCKLEIAVGEIKLNDSLKIMGGPVDSLKELSNKYAILAPGNIKKNDLARKLASIFNVSVDSVDRVLPPGGSNIIKTIGFDLEI